MADPASDDVLVAVAVVLAVAGGAIWWLGQRPGRVSVIALAAVNAAGAVFFITWLAAADGFSAPAAGLVVVVSAALAGLAIAEAAALPPAETASGRT